jgi:transcriptional regulator with XRE-family HTH domain
VAASIIGVARSRSGLTIRAVGRLAGVSHATVTMLEHRLRAPSRATAEALAQALRLTGTEREQVLAAGLEGVGRSSEWWGPSGGPE